MKAIVCNEFAPVDELALEEIAEPTVGEGEVLVDVRAIGVNFPEGLLVQGLYQSKPPRPFVPGVEFAGVVERCGDGAEGFAAGDRVIGLSPGIGAYAEKIACPAARLMPLPQEMDFATGAALVLATGTAHHALRQRGQLQAGETLVVLGAAGGTGIAAVHIGKALGARVIAVCSTQAKLDLAAEYGADELVNYTDVDLKEAIKELTGGKGADVVYDAVGGEAFDACTRAMAPGGRLLVIGFASGTIPKLPVNLALVKEFSVVGVFWGNWTRREPQAFAKNMRELFAWCADGTVRVAIDEVLQLGQAPAALRKVLGREVRGKLVLEP